MGLEGVNGLFGGVGAVVIRGYKVDIDVFLFEEHFEGCWTLVVANLDGRLESFADEVVIE